MGNSVFNMVLSYREIATLNNDYIRPTTYSAEIINPNEITYEFNSPSSSPPRQQSFSKPTSLLPSFLSTKQEDKILYKIPEEEPILSSPRESQSPEQNT